MRSIHARNPISACMLLAATMCVCAGVRADDLFCPESVNVQQSAVAPPAGWTPSLSDASHRLEMVTFFSGPPEEQASLVYDRLTRLQSTSVARWNLPRDARGYWIRCSYTGTSVELSRRLAPEVRVCEVTYDREVSTRAGLPAIKAIACR
jgi:hypothetical protein